MNRLWAEIMATLEAIRAIERHGGAMIFERAFTRFAALPAAVESAPKHADVFNEAAKHPIDLTAEFGRAAGSDDSAGEASGGSGQDPAPEAEIKIQRRRRTREHARDTQRSAEPTQSDAEKGENDLAPDNPAPRRRRRRHFDRRR